MNRKKRTFKSELHQYVTNTEEVRRLSSVNVKKLKNNRDYAETLRDNFIRIREISIDNRRILSEVLYPVITSDDLLTTEQMEGLKELMEELMDIHTIENLDIPILEKTVSRLYRDANEKNILPYMIKQLETQIESYYTLAYYTSRVTQNQKIALDYVNKSQKAIGRLLEFIKKENFREIKDEESRDAILIGNRFMSAIFEGICGRSDINEQAVMLDAKALAILDDPFYKNEMPDYDWDYYEMRCLEYISTMTEGNNRRGFKQEHLELAYECSKRLCEKCEAMPEYCNEYIAESEKRLVMARNSFLTGRLSKEDYKDELLSIYKTRNKNSYVADDVFDNILIPLEYVSIVKNDVLTEKERRIILGFYRELVSYAHNTTNSGELMIILNYYYAFLENFIEVSGKFTFEDMCLESIAAFHPPTYIHSNMVAVISRCLCRFLLNKNPELFIGVLECKDIEDVKSKRNEILARIYHGALIHDVGKLAIIDTIFVYGRNITDEEYNLIRMHPEAGYYLAREGTSLYTYRDMILYHHRSYDEKSGYPVKSDDGQSPDKILIDIIAMSDCMDAATDSVGRSYAAGKTLEQFKEEVMEGSGTRYNPFVAALLSDADVYEDISFLLTKGRENIYSDTYYLLKNVQQQGEGHADNEDIVDEFKKFLKRKSQYDTAVSLLTYDLETTAPEKGIDEKADTLAMISLRLKEYLTSPDSEHLFRVFAKEDIDDVALNKSYEILKEKFDKQKRIPNAFYEAYIKETAISEKAWEHAKEQSDFSIFAPHLEKIISMTKEMCSYTDPDMTAYDALLDKYERGVGQADIDVLFSDVKKGIHALLNEIDRRPAFDSSILNGKYDIDAQRKVTRLLLDYIGFDMSAGVVSESVHPLTTRISFGDIRLTNSYKQNDALSAMFSAIHEGGHAVYEQGLDKKYRFTEIEYVPWMGIHESQSRFYENILGRNINFWKPIYPDIQKLLPKFKDIDLDTFERAINNVHRSLIRIDADEVSYCLHIILRYEMEKAIFTDDVPVNELPGLWNKKSEEILGIKPGNDAEGILQDMHWSDGSFGYFPSYLLGNIYGGMLLTEVEKELGDVDEILARGDIKKITKWLTDKIFRHGALYTGKELITGICRKNITAYDMLAYFNKKYSRIYGF